VSQTINDQNYDFDLHLPPKPRPNARAVSSVTHVAGPVLEPLVVPFPPDDPKLLRVEIPLRGVEPEPDQYGIIVAGGWTDPEGSDASANIRVVVTIHALRILRVIGGAALVVNLRITVGVNGRWRSYHHLNQPPPFQQPDIFLHPPHRVVLDLQPRDSIRVSASGFVANAIDTVMGRPTGLTWSDVSDVSDPAQVAAVAERMADAGLNLDVLTAGILDNPVENFPIGEVREIHSPSARFIREPWISDREDYSLVYSIQSG
jgi:hypothetical protein